MAAGTSEPEAGAKRRRWGLMLAILAGVPLFSWVLTATWGVADVESRILDPLRVESRREGFNVLDHDPRAEHDSPQPDKPWHYVGQAHSYLPFVVAADNAAELGVGEYGANQGYWFWFFGLVVEIGYSN